MSLRRKSWQTAIAFALVAGGIFALYEWRRSPADYDAAHLLQSLPLNHAVKVYANVDALRSARLLDLIAGSQSEEEPDYRRFVEETGFDYRRDLDAVAAAFVHGDVYMAVRGHFDWKRLSEYAQAQHGTCSNGLCTMPASSPSRNISYYRMGVSVLALAVTADGRGAAKIVPPNRAVAAFVPSAPVWISAPGDAFRDLSGLPDGSHILSPLAEAQEVSFNVLQEEIRLDAACASTEIAARIAQNLMMTTNLLKAMLQRDKLNASSSDLSGVLVAGKFETQATHAIGTWPLQKHFIESLFSGTSR